MGNNLKRKMVFIILTISCALAIFAFSNQIATTSDALSRGISEKFLEAFTDFEDLSYNEQLQELAQFNETVRSVAHFGVFLLLGIFTYALLSTTKLKRPFILALILCVAYAVFDELYQEFFSEGRAFQVEDLAKDWSGSLIGIGITGLCRRKVIRTTK